MKKSSKYQYVTVIQQQYGCGWEDVSEYETDSQYIPKDKSDKLSPLGRPESLLRHDLREYRTLGYPTRTINRRLLNANAIS